MKTHVFGDLGDVSVLSLGGGGLGRIWGLTTREETVATARAAVDSGITLLDMAPSYGDGEAESVIGEAFGGKLPTGVRITTKCRVAQTPANDIPKLLEQSLAASLERMRLERVDLLFLHNFIGADDDTANDRTTRRSVLLDAVIPTFEKLKTQGRIGGWALTGIGIPPILIELLDGGVKPSAIQCIANLLDSPGNLKRYESPAMPRDVIAAANRAGVPVMGIRVVQAGALTDSIDRNLPADHPETLDYQRAAPFREFAKQIGESPASLAHRYALSMDGLSTAVLGVKNRAELQECVDAADTGPLSPDVIARIDASVR
jgi:aryl-alcohol dehydrogenase-like predicted oxidoreductase